MTKIAVWQLGARSCAAIANASRDALTRALSCEMEIEIGLARDERVLLGAFQRAGDVEEGARKNAIVRGTPGGAVFVGIGSLQVLVGIAKLECDESQILNRHVRPILRALGGNYFGRDWISILSGGAQHPVAHVGFAHERATGRTVVEAFIGVRTPFAASLERASYRGKKIVTLEEARGKKIDNDDLASAIADAFGEHVAFEGTSREEVVENADPPWSARIDEAIGPVCAGRDAKGRMRVGGEFMASLDAVRDLEARIESGQEPRGAVNDAFGAPHTALFGVRTLESFARAWTAAMRPR